MGLRTKSGSTAGRNRTKPKGRCLKKGSAIAKKKPAHERRNGQKRASARAETSRRNGPKRASARAETSQRNGKAKQAESEYLRA